MEVQFERYPRIVVTADTCSGQPRITGTRITVSAILSYLAGGASAEALVADFDSIQLEDIYQALAFASENLQGRMIPFAYKSAS
jgi:uncharacterized protein (DUF433 family)